ncbi:sigma-54 interaction domain-containing protein [Sinanaerobacter chloroacetimidivorans]|jgi:PAS domain S-box-containing protein|uniref:Sigma 54-interacting transcriptional regulator n=1 Tax=Sinanaerobacter chloroacetimidivorans TaxID=2818044 RepID=A0A8J7W089_9FIRM|nr:sigma 54-interacting transcriptional regulator [Sinanaerobacter chloroacetimidivorans]MBR0598397.1 sigma 54-interacting transcriptional regulator [Sinanaerobacter chloroacetimidivorans]
MKQIGKKIGRRKLKRKNQEEFAREIDTILDAIHDDILITDGTGKILKVSKSFASVYGIGEDYILGKTVFEMEKKGVFKPSIIAKVLESDQKVTMRQKNSLGRELIVTATPVRNQQGKIEKVVSFTRDLTDYLNLQEQYSALESKMEKYTAEIEELRSKIVTIEGIVGNSESIREVIRTINKIAKFDANVLFLGPSGVGKTMFSRFVHNKSNRSTGPFIEINCAAIPDNLLESELFGYEKGSFTGAGQDGKIGLIELAQGGTLMLDEISEIPLNLQAKILKVIQDKTITRVGGTREIKVDFRLIAASNRDMEELTAQNKFRQDLYYRLNVITIHIPPLKDRKEDIIPLVSYFIDKFNKKYSLEKSLHPQTMDKLLEYNWPGNVRELENILERVMLTSEGNKITKEALPQVILCSDKRGEAPPGCGNLMQALEDLEGALIKEAYNRCGTSVGVAKALQISQPTAVRKIRKYMK